MALSVSPLSKTVIKVGGGGAFLKLRINERVAPMKFINLKSL